MQDEVKRTLRLRRINDKGWEVAQALERIKADKEVDLQRLDPLFFRAASPGEREPKERRLRRFLDAINDARRRLPTAEYGRCTRCGVAFDEAVLDEQPWIAICSVCEARLAEPFRS